MSIFDNIKVPKDTERDLVIELKYGPIRPDDSFLDKLPEAVVKFAYDATHTHMPAHLRSLRYPTPIELQRQTLHIMLRQPDNVEKATQAIKRALTLYHSMIG